MTCERRDGQHQTPFSKWTREQPELDSKEGYHFHDVDWCWYHFKQHKDHRGERNIHNILFVEIKTWGAKPTWSQRSTISVVNQILLHGVRDGYPRTYPITMDNGMKAKARYWGWHLLTFEKAGPYDSTKAWWDESQISRQILIEVLRFDRSPLTLRGRDDDSRHGQKNQQPELF